MPLLPEQLDLLRRAELAALVRGRWGEVGGEPGPFPSGATLRAGGRGWVLCTRAGPRSLGGALVWAAARGVTELAVLVDDHAPTLAREATRFDWSIGVWRIDGAELVAAEPAADPIRSAASADAAVLAAELELAGLDVVVEFGVVRAEVLGLEIARVVEDGEGGGPEGPRLEAGVGRFDREMSALMHRGAPPMEAVAAAAAAVRTHRHRGAPPHPLRDLCRERWLRCELLAHPDALGATRLEPVETTVDRPNLRDPWPALAVGTAAGGGPIVVAATVGVDLDAVVLAADTRAAVAPEADLVVVSTEPLPASIRAVGARLARPARFVEVAPPWV